MRRIITLALYVCILPLMACEAERGEPCGAEVGGQAGTYCEAGLYCKGDVEDLEREAESMAFGERASTGVDPAVGVCEPAKEPGERCMGFWLECWDGECVQGRCVRAISR